MKAEKSDWIMLRCRPDVCQDCAIDHDPDQPHDQTSLYYQMKFHKDHKRWPTWHDAMAHCTDDVKADWIWGLKEMGIKIDE